MGSKEIRNRAGARKAIDCSSAENVSAWSAERNREMVKKGLYSKGYSQRGSSETSTPTHKLLLDIPPIDSSSYF